MRSVSWIFLIALVNKFGAEVAAAYGIGIRVDMFAFFPALSIGIAVSAIAAQNIGARNTQRVNETLKKAILLSLVFSSLIYVFVNLFMCGLCLQLF